MDNNSKRENRQMDINEGRLNTLRSIRELKNYNQCRFQQALQVRKIKIII